jgi:hypothetical protein
MLLAWPRLRHPRNPNRFTSSSLLKNSRLRYSEVTTQRTDSDFCPLTSVFCSGGADRDRTDDPLLAKQVLSQLSYSPRHQKSGVRRQESVGLCGATRAPRCFLTSVLCLLTSDVVGLGGLEPPTPRLSSVCSNQLSYRPAQLAVGSRPRCQPRSCHWQLIPVNCYNR